MTLHDEELRALGLTRDQLNDDWVTLARACDDTGDSRSAAAALTLAALVAGRPPAPVEPVRLSPATQLDVVVERPQGVDEVLRLTARPGTPLRVIGPGVEVVLAEGEPWKAAVRLQPGKAVRVDVGPAAGFVLKLGGKTRADARAALEAASFDVIRLDVPLQPSIISPVGDWCVQCADEWLQAAVEQRLSGGGRWSQLAATGLYARLLQRGEGHDARPFAWALALDESQRRYAEQLAAAAVTILHTALRDLSDTYAPTNITWLDALRDVCWRRDDLEGVRVLLRASGPSDDLDDDLRDLDEAGTTFMRSLPVMPQLDDQRLRRVAERHPAVWWSAFATGV
jgi:hypothetical protein